MMVKISGKDPNGHMHDLAKNIQRIMNQMDYSTELCFNGEWSLMPHARSIGHIAITAKQSDLQETK